MPASLTNKKVHGNRFKLTPKLAAAALVQSGTVSVRQAAQELGMSERTLYRVKNDPEIMDLHANEVSEIKDALTKLTYKRSFESLKSINQNKLDSSSALQLMTVAAIGIEKGRLMEGLSTENVSHRGVMQTLESDRQRLADKIKTLEDSL